MDITKIREIQARNRAAMEAENRAKAEAKAAEEAAEESRKANAERFHAESMVQLTNLVLSPRLGGRPLPRATVTRLNEIRTRSQNTLDTLSRKEQDR